MTTCGPEDSDLNVDQANFRKLHENATKAGYADGVAAGEEMVFQQSFDKGYADGLRTGLELKKFHSFFATISKTSYKNITPTYLLEEACGYEKLSVTDASETYQLQTSFSEAKPLDEISNCQHQCLEKHIIEFEEKLPHTCNLFSLKN